LFVNAHFDVRLDHILDVDEIDPEIFLLRERVPRQAAPDQPHRAAEDDLLSGTVNSGQPGTNVWFLKNLSIYFSQ
jgi:hypothetical protein